MRATLIVLMLTVATQAGTECGNLCDSDWWNSTITANVQAELDAGADAMARDEDGDTPLHWAAWWGTAKNIQELLDAGASVRARNKYGDTPLHDAAWWGTHENIQALLDAGASVRALDEDGDTPLHNAALCISCKPGKIQALLTAGADGKAKNKEGKTPWDFAQDNEDLKGTKGYWALNDAQHN